MGYIAGEDREQTILFPEALDDYVSEDNSVRFMDAFVEALDMNELGFERATAKEIGRPGYNPRDLLQLYVYGIRERGAAVDGGKFRAVNSRERNFSRKKLEQLQSSIDRRIEDYLKSLDEGDAND